MKHLHNPSTLMPWCKVKLRGDESDSMRVEDVTCRPCLHEYREQRQNDYRAALAQLDVLGEAVRP